MARRLLAALLAALAAACGETLVDHRAGDLLNPPGNGCVTVDACGPSCETCTAAPSGAVPACLGAPGAEQCDYECQGGLLKCAGGCCPAAQVAAGEAHTCAIAGSPDAGDLFCWGANGSKQAAPDVVSGVYARPRRVRGGVTAVALGRTHTCAVSAGAVSCWGANGSGQAAVPAGLSGVVALAAGATFTCALDGGGAVTCWGGGMPAAPALGGAATAISAGAGHACALVGGAARCWGAGAQGQLGDGTITAFSSQPVEALTGVAALAAGADLTCAGAAVPSGGAIDDALRCWGTGLGALLDADPALTPTIPMKDANQSVVRFEVDALGVGRAHACVKRNGAAESVECLGADGGFGQLGGAIVSPPEAIIVPGTQNALGFAVGADHACAVLSTGGVQCWGRNSSGQLGDGTDVTPGVGGDARPIGTPVPISGL